MNKGNAIEHSNQIMSAWACFRQGLVDMPANSPEAVDELKTALTELATSTSLFVKTIEETGIESGSAVAPVVHLELSPSQAQLLSAALEGSLRNATKAVVASIESTRTAAVVQQHIKDIQDLLAIVRASAK